MVFPLQHLQISPDFDSFSKFLEKLEISFGYIFWCYVQDSKIHFSSYFQGFTISFSLETHPKRLKIFNILNIHPIRNLEYEPWCKIEWLRDFDKIFEFWSILPLFIKKIISPNKVIWVLTWSVLMRWVQWCAREFL